MQLVLLINSIKAKMQSWTVLVLCLDSLDQEEEPNAAVPADGLC